MEAILKNIYFYSTIKAWIDETPDVTIVGTVTSKTSNYIEISDENGYTQIINLDKIFAVVY